MSSIRDILTEHDGHVLDEFNNPTPWEPRYTCACGETVKSWTEHVSAIIEAASGADNASKGLSLEETEAAARRAFDGAYIEVHTDLILQNKGASGFQRTGFGRTATKAGLAAASPILRGFGERKAYGELAVLMDAFYEDAAAAIIRERLDEH